MTQGEGEAVFLEKKLIMVISQCRLKGAEVYAQCTAEI